MGFQVSPGVQVKEINGTNVIPAVSTSIGGFAGAFNWGPVETITTIGSENELAATFATPTPVNAKYFLTAAGFLQYGNNLSTVRVLDEATSSIDTYSEQLIQRATEKITEGRTSIIIAHRLATIKKADKIIVMDAGKIMESGTHKELLKKGGYYSNLYEAQFLAEELA